MDAKYEGIIIIIVIYRESYLNFIAFSLQSICILNALLLQFICIIFAIKLNHHNNNEYITTFSYTSFYQLYNIIFISVYLKASSIVLHFEVIIYKNNKIHLFTINLIFTYKNDKSIWIFKKITKLMYFSITLLKSSIAIKLEE